MYGCRVSTECHLLSSRHLFRILRILMRLPRTVHLASKMGSLAATHCSSPLIPWKPRMPYASVLRAHVGKVVTSIRRCRLHKVTTSIVVLVQVPRAWRTSPGVPGTLWPKLWRQPRLWCARRVWREGDMVDKSVLEGDESLKGLKRPSRRRTLFVQCVLQCSGQRSQVST